MKILIGDKGNVDFDRAIKMSEEQKNKFIKFLKSLFAVIEEKSVDYFRYDRIGDKLFYKEWETKEKEILLDMELNNYTISEMLGRSWLSVDIKRGPLISQLLSWVGKMGKDLLKRDSKKIIEEFLKYTQDKKDKRKSLKKEAMEIKYEIENSPGTGLNNIDYWRKKQERLEEIKKELDELDRE